MTSPEFEIKRGLSLEEVKDLVDGLLATKQVAEQNIDVLNCLIKKHESDETKREKVEYWNRNLQAAWARRNHAQRILNMIEVCQMEDGE